MQEVCLFGPFVGEFSWEMFKFAPYAISYKKKYPKRKLIVYTRPERFDLYGSYADIFVPLQIKNDNEALHQQFGLKGLNNKGYKGVVNTFERKYKHSLDVKDHFYPDIKKTGLRWQHPKDQMDYMFSPRPKNEELVINTIPSQKNIFIDLSGMYIEEGFHFLSVIDKLFDKKINFFCYSPNGEKTKLIHSSRNIFDIRRDFNVDNKKSTVFGCAAFLLKRCLFTITMNLSVYSHLSLLSGTRLYMLRNYPVDYIELMNPLNTKIDYINNIENIKNPHIETIKPISKKGFEL